MDSRVIFWLHELGREDVNLVGQKCAFLAEMMQIGLPVPPGFVLSLSAFDNFMETTSVREEILGYLSKLGETSGDLRLAEVASRHIYDIIKKKEIPQRICRQVEASYQKLSQQLGTDETPVSVRSSGRQSHPGLFDTYLNIKGSRALLHRIKCCWASVFSPRAIVTLARKGLVAQIEPIAIGVQKMVYARSAGVLFTTDLVNNDPSLVVIEASWGLGEGVAQAKVNPDKFVVNKETLNVKEKYIGQKTCQVVAIEQGTKVETVPKEKQAIPCLSDEELTHLVKLAKQVELHDGGIPQDIEWAVDAELPFPENIFLIQTRPVVVPSPPSSKLNKPPGKGDTEHIADLLIERFYHAPRPPTPKHDQQYPTSSC
jgi:pyruvate,water dikinase